MHPSSVDFEEADNQLQRAGATLDAAEAHGYITGVLCTGSAPLASRWQAELLGELDRNDIQVRAAARLLDTMAQGIQVQLNSPDLDFAPLLPEDDLPLSERAESLASWVQGFLSGLGHGGLAAAGLKGDAKEFLQDLDEIARLDLRLEDAGEEEERAYAEILEYLRMGVLMLQEELAPMPGSGPLH